MTGPIAHCGKSGEGLEFADTMLVNYTDADDIEVHEGSCGFRQYDAPYFGAVHSMTTTGERLQDLFAQYGTRTTHRTDGYDYGLHFTEDAAPVNGEAAAASTSCSRQTRSPTFPTTPKRAATRARSGTVPTRTEIPARASYLKTSSSSTPPPRPASTRRTTLPFTPTTIRTPVTSSTGGYAEPITWSRGSVNEPFRYYTSDGSELQLGVGKTYIAFVSEYYGGASYS